MENQAHKIISLDKDEEFAITNSFLKLLKKLKTLKNTKGRMILIIGAPGTGKSSNIFHALDALNLNFYEPVLLLDSVKTSSKDVYKEIYNTIGKDLDVETEEEAFEEFSKFDLVLIADKFLDSEFLDESKIGLAEWTNYRTILAIPFFLMWIIEFIRHRNHLKKFNLVFQTAWTIQIRGFKYDLITDFGIFSIIFSSILKKLFEVVEIAYTQEEIIKIIKNQYPDIEETQIKIYIKKYGHKPRFILDELQKKKMISKSKKEGFNTGKLVSKPR
jgi:hypothetical protein